jgi:hypothetical protein
MISNKIKNMGYRMEQLGVPKSRIAYYCTSAQQEIKSSAMALAVKIISESQVAATDGVSPSTILKNIELDFNSGYAHMTPSSDNQHEVSDVPFPQLPWAKKQSNGIERQPEPNTTASKNQSAVTSGVDGQNKLSEMASQVANAMITIPKNKLSKNKNQIAEDHRESDSPSFSAKKDITASIMDLNSKMIVEIETIADSIINKYIKIATSDIRRR